MKSIMPQLNAKSTVPIYLQLFEYIRNSILAGEIVYGEKLPSLRNLSDALGISITTTGLAYEQLEVEGYIVSKPRSGYYVRELSFPQRNSSNAVSIGRPDIYGSDFDKSDIGGSDFDKSDIGRSNIGKSDAGRYYFGRPDSAKAFTQDKQMISESIPQRKDYQYDLSSFDFVKWKKCFSKVLNEHPEELLFESDPQGEPALRNEIAKYVFYSRGVRCRPDQIVIAAGMQQITALLASLLKHVGIEHVAVEKPGYDPVISSFRDRSFAITEVPVREDGIQIEKLPANIQAAAYVNPSNQFPTGAVMPIARRYQLLEWADSNNSYIIEDDYDSELRYIGRPIPAMQGLDTHDRVIYLGSFSSTLFAAIKISYMVLPDILADVYHNISSTYTQTCSKTEQLTLALFMEKGYYQTGIKKIRRLYSQKLNAVIEAFADDQEIQTTNTFSGINVLLRTSSTKKDSIKSDSAKSDSIKSDPAKSDSAQSDSNDLTRKILSRAGDLGIKMQLISDDKLLFYYNQIPLEEIPKLVDELRKK